MFLFLLINIFAILFTTKKKKDLENGKKAALLFLTCFGEESSLTFPSFSI